MKPSIVKLFNLLLVFVTLLLLNQSCKKVKEDSLINKEIRNRNHLLEDQFFKIDVSVPNIVKKVIVYLNSRNNKSAIAAKIIAEVGLPAWDKSIIISTSKSISKNLIGSNVLLAGDSGYVFVPIVPLGTQEVDGMLACKVERDSVYIHFIKEKDYKNYGFNNSDTSAMHLAALMIYLQNQAFGLKNYVIKDPRLLTNDPAVDSTKHTLLKLINNLSFSGNKSSQSNIYSTTTIEICFRYLYSDNSLLAKSNLENVVGWADKCILIYAYNWVDMSNNSNYYFSSLPPEGDNSGGGTYYYQDDPPSVSVPYELNSIIGLNQDEYDFTVANPDLSNEIFGYINTELEGDNYSSILLKNQALLRVVSLSKSHLDYLRNSQGYFNFCNNRVLANISLTGNSFEWFSKYSISFSNPELYSNILTLKLNAEQGYYLLNNSIVNIAINQFLNANNNSEIAKSIGIWAINYLKQNPNVDFSIFQNQFLGIAEGKDTDSDDTYWDDPNNIFSPQDLPTWANFEAAYPKKNGKNMTVEDVFDLVGGPIKTKRDNSLADNIPENDIQNACALRMSRALNYSGIVIPHIQNITFLGADNKYYFLGAANLNRWMRKTFGCANPNITIGEYLNSNSSHFNTAQIGQYGQNLPSLLAGKKGIYTIVTNTDWASGHCDMLYDNATCIGNCHFDAPTTIYYCDVWDLH